MQISAVLQPTSLIAVRDAYVATRDLSFVKLCQTVELEPQADGQFLSNEGMDPNGFVTFSPDHKSLRCFKLTQLDCLVLLG